MCLLLFRTKSNESQAMLGYFLPLCNCTCNLGQDGAFPFPYHCVKTFGNDIHLHQDWNDGLVVYIDKSKERL